MENKNEKYVYYDEEFHVTQQYYDQFAARFEKKYGRKPGEEDLLAHLRHKYRVLSIVFMCVPPAFVILLILSLICGGDFFSPGMSAAEVLVAVLLAIGGLSLACLFSLYIRCLSHPDLKARNRAAVPVKKAPVILLSSLLCLVLASLLAMKALFPFGAVLCAASLIIDLIFSLKLLSALKKPEN